jgi:hypothetical protein
MNRVLNKLLIAGLVASIAALAVDRGGAKFTPPALDAMPNKQTIEGVTIGVKAYNHESEAKTAFGKVHPYEHGILPVLVVMRNDSKKTIRLADMLAQYVRGGRDKIEAVPASDVKYTQAPRRPNMNPGPIPGIRFGKKNPLAAEEIEIRAFTAKMLPPGESAHGFFYFQTGHRNGSTFYVTGLKDASSGQELFFFEIPID